MVSEAFLAVSLSHQSIPTRACELQAQTDAFSIYCLILPAGEQSRHQNQNALPYHCQLSHQRWYRPWTSASRYSGGPLVWARNWAFAHLTAWLHRFIWSSSAARVKTLLLSHFTRHWLVVALGKLLKGSKGNVSSWSLLPIPHSTVQLHAWEVCRCELNQSYDIHKWS